MALPSKQVLKAELLALLRVELDTLEHAHRETNAGATHEEAKPENDKDTRALEQSYLARGQAQRVIDLRNALLETEAMALRAFGANDPVSLGALVTVEEEDEERILFLACQGGGSALAGGKVRVVTPQSPLGRALLGKRAGEDCEVRLKERTRELVIIRVD